MKAYIFPGQGAQFTGMGLPLYENSPAAKSLFEQANDILGFMQNNYQLLNLNSQAALLIILATVFIAGTMILAKSLGQDWLGQGLHPFQISALVANGTLAFEGWP